MFLCLVTPLLVKQLGVDAAAATLLATTAARQGYTPAQFRTLLAQVCAAPDTTHPFGVLYARVSQPPPAGAPEVP